MSNYLPGETLEEIKAGVAAGLSLRAIARATGCSTNTVRRYYPKDSAPPCACGAPAGHKGWCKARYSESLARQAFHARRRGEIIHVPQQTRKSRIKNTRAAFEFVFGIADDWRDRATPLAPDQHYGVIGEVMAVTKRVAADFRDDVRQSLILAVYEGRVQRDKIDKMVGPFVKFEMRQAIGAMWSLYLSLHAPTGAGVGLDHLSMLSTLDEDGVWRGSPLPS